MQRQPELDESNLVDAEALATTTDLPPWLPAILNRMKACSLAVFGDFCIDAYWELHEEANEYSVETGLKVRQVKMQRYSLGGAGNVLTNLAALGVGHVQAIGVSGADPFGAVMQDMLSRYCEYRCDVIEDPSWETMVYAKPCVGDREESRIDFGAFNDPGQALADRLLEHLERAANEHDVVILNQQVEGGLSSPKLIESINGIIARSKKALFLVDARHHPEKYVGALLKVNMSEAAKLLGEEPVSLDEDARAIDFASRIHAITSKAAFVTRGEHGMAVAADGTVQLIEGLPVEGPTDTVGAGDTVVASVAAALAAGASPWQAGAIANVAAMITVKKLQTTGTASPEEILLVAASLNLDPVERTSSANGAIFNGRSA